MSNFKFKVPELPEDTLARRKASNIQFRSEKNASANESSNDYCRPTSSRFTRQSGVFNSFSLRNCNTFQPIREYIQEDHAQPSTSRQNNVLSDRSNNSNMIEGPFGQFGNQTCFENTFQSRYNYHNVRGCNRDSTSNYNQMDCFNCGSKPFRDMNFSASHNNTSVFKSNVNNSLCFNNQGLRGMNSSVYAEPQNCTSVNFHQPSFLRENQSVFGRSLLSGRGRIVQSNVSVNDTRNRISFRQNAHETLNGSSVLRSDNMFNINANNSVADLPSVMKSFLQISNISMKEEILNKFESYGQKLLRMAPDLGTSFFGFAKEVESILEKNTKFRGTTETLLSTLICTPRDCQEKTILKNEKPPETKVMPKNILSAIKSKNKTNNLQFITSFTTEKKRNETDEFDSELDFNPTPDKKSSSKDEINLKDWYPVAVADGLAFFGKNDENVAFETAVMKKRISNRKVLLTDGRVCNLVGNPSKAQNYPPHITTRIKDGLNTRWKKLVDIIGNFQKTLQKEKGRTRAAEVAERDISINTPLRSNAKEVSKVVKTGTKIEIKSSNVSSKERDKSGDRKSEKPARKTAAPQKNSTTEESKKNASEDEENKEEKSRVLGTTRSGRIVKRPSVLWIGDSFNKTYVGSNSSANSKNKQKSESPKSENETESPSLKRKRGAPKAPDVQAKKSKPEPQTKQSTKTEKNKGRKGNSKSAQKTPVKAKESPVAIKKDQKNRTKKVRNKFEPIANNPWGNEIEEGLDGIYIPDVSVHKEFRPEKNKLNMLGAETPPLQLLRNNLKILKACTPVQSPDWQVSQHTRSEVKKFEKLRAQAFRKKIPKENNPKTVNKKKSATQNKDVDTFMNWVSQKEVKSPTKCSKVLKYVMPKKQDLQDEESEDELGNTMEQ